MATLTFPLGVILLWALENPKFEVASSSRCKNIKGNSKIFGSSPSPWPRPLFLLVWFYDGAWQSKLYTKFEIASLSCYRNIIGKPQNFRELPYTRATPTFLLRGISWWVLVIPSGLPNLKSLASFLRWRKFVLKNWDKPKWGNPLLFGETDFTVGFADPMSMFPIRCATVVELRLQQMGDFYEKPHFTMKNFKFRQAVKWGLKIFALNHQKAHPYAKSGRTNRLAYVAATLFWRYTAASK